MSSKKKSILLKQRPLYERYPNMDYPENSDDESAETRAKFEKIRGGPMDVLDELDAFMEEAEAPVPSLVKKETPPPSKKKTAAKRFTPASGYLHYIMTIAYKYGCSENEHYQNPPDEVNDSPELLEEKRAIIERQTGQKRFYVWLEEHKTTINSHMLKSGNEKLCEFYQVLMTYPRLAVTKVTPTNTNAWSGSAIDADTRITVYSAEGDKRSIDVNENQGVVLRICHQVNHLPGYVLEFLSDAFPEGNTHRFPDLWENQLMGKYAKQTELLKWTNSNCNQLEEDILNLYSAINITIEWLKKLKKK